MNNMARMLEMKMRDGRERGAATESLYITKHEYRIRRGAALEVSNKEIERVITGIKGSELEEDALKKIREELITGKYRTLAAHNSMIAEIVQKSEKIERELSLSGKPILWNPFAERCSGFQNIRKDECVENCSLVHFIYRVAELCPLYKIQIYC